MRRRGKKAAGLGLLMGVMLTRFTRKRRKADAGTMREMEFSSSARRMGVTFPDSLRDKYRRRWVRKTRQ